jgi:O-antigen ligase
MRGPLLALCFVSLSLAWLVFFGAGVRQTEWDAALLFLGATALFYWTFRSGQTPPSLHNWHLIALWTLPLYAAFQLLPLPLSILRILSPARALIAESVAAVIPNLTGAPISVAPAAAMAGLFSLLGYLTVFSLVRDVAWRFVETRPWLPAAPLVFIATMESAIGVGQWLGGLSGTYLRGTLSNTELFAALLEIALPFTLVSGFISFRRHQTQPSPSALPAARAAMSWLASLLVLSALAHSPSHASRVVVTGSLFVLLVFALVPRLKTRRLRLYGVAASTFIFLTGCLMAAPPVDFVRSLAQLGSRDQTAAENRLAIWNNSAALFAEFPWFGNGMGGFASTYPKYQGSADLTRVQNPHNDALGLLIAFGTAGSCIVVVVMVGVARPAVMGALFLSNEPRRLLAASITASLSAVILRAVLESTLSAPVIALAFAWLAGLSQSSGLD